MGRFIVEQQPVMASRSLRRSSRDGTRGCHPRIWPHNRVL